MKNKIFILTSLIASHGFAQGILNNGAQIVMNTGSHIYIAGGASGNYTSQSGGAIAVPGTSANFWLEGNWVNNSTNQGFLNDNSTVNFVGANQSIGGTNFTHFYNVNLLGTGTKTLNVNTRVGGFGGTPNGVLALGTRPLVLNGFDLWTFNTAAGAITNTTGYIQSETNVALNPSTVTWDMGTTTGAHVYPFGTVAGTLIPLTFNKTSATSSRITISTRPTAASNNLPWSSTVTHMFDPTLNQDGSDEAVIDRWWDITCTAATNADITFSYLGTENTLIPPYNTGIIGGQYWAAAWLPNNAIIGGSPAVLVGTGTASVPGLSFAASVYTPMVLSSQLAPLPIELLDFNATCSGDRVLVSWSTASETNNDFFTIEKSTDGLNFIPIGTVNGAGNSTSVLHYHWEDLNPYAGTSYYRIRQTDYNGVSSTSQIVVLEHCGNATVNVYNAFSTGDDIIVSFQLVNSGTYTIKIYDDRGRLVSYAQYSAGEGSSTYRKENFAHATGIYFLQITDRQGVVFLKKIFLIREN